MTEADEPAAELAAVDERSADLDLDAILAEIRAAAADKRRSGTYPPEFLALLEEPLAIDPDPTFVAGPAWQEAVRSADARVDLQLDSTRPLVGSLVVFTKRLVRRALRWYLPPVIDQVNAHHRAVVEVLAEHNRQIADLQRRLLHGGGGGDGQSSEPDQRA